QAFHRWLRGEPEPADQTPLGRDGVEAAFCALARGLARNRVVVWVIEDLHFASDETRRVLAAIARVALGESLLVIATQRPGWTPERLVPAGHTAGHTAG